MEEPWDYAFETHDSKEISCQICGAPRVSWKLEVFPGNIEKYDCVFTCNMMCLSKYLQKKGFKS
ncbi:MAG: hypothetical protein WC511_02360 [Candidatus Pacearchaeota archaeon]